MRSAAEIAFRLKQEIVNAYQYASPPDVQLDPNFKPRIQLPDPAAIAAALQGTAFAEQVRSLAEQIRQHRFPILGLTVDTGPEIPWRRDYTSGVETDLRYFRRIPYLDVRRTGDHKVIWEPNRYQHLVLLAQAFCFTGDSADLAEIRAQLESWFLANPYNRGINWASALEVAFRALSWIWTYHLVGGQMIAEFRMKWLRQLYQHACHLENNLSFYFSPNTHLLGEALALHALGLFFAGLPRAAHWEQTGARVMREQMERQVRVDGSHFEQSTYYHLYAADMFLLHAILAKPDREYMDKLEKMVEYLNAVMGPSRILPFLGDDDGGRLFHPYGDRSHFGRATLATAGIVLDRQHWQWDTTDLHEQAVWWLGVSALDRKPGEGKWESRLFSDAGVAAMTAGANQVLFDAGSFGPWGAGHSHADALSIVVRSGDEEILIDPGTCTYVGEQKWRDWFRGTEAHNTVRIDGRDQATAAGPFRWTNHPEVTILSWKTNAKRDAMEAECRYRGFTHRRSVEFQKPNVVLIVDEIEGPPGEHDVEQLWHLGSLAARARLVLPEGGELVESWRSCVFGEKHSSPMVRLRRRCTLPVRLEAKVVL
ncbi:MAG: alginate lyase family protein [Bryobacteraceae bacterium]